MTPGLLGLFGLRNGGRGRDYTVCGFASPAVSHALCPGLSGDKRNIPTPSTASQMSPTVTSLSLTLLILDDRASSSTQMKLILPQTSSLLVIQANGGMPLIFVEVSGGLCTYWISRGSSIGLFKASKRSYPEAPGLRIFTSRYISSGCKDTYWCRPFLGEQPCTILCLVAKREIVTTE